MSLDTSVSTTERSERYPSPTSVGSSSEDRFAPSLFTPARPRGSSVPSLISSARPRGSSVPSLISSATLNEQVPSHGNVRVQSSQGNLAEPCIETGEPRSTSSLRHIESSSRSSASSLVGVETTSHTAFTLSPCMSLARPPVRVLQEQREAEEQRSRLQQKSVSGKRDGHGMSQNKTESPFLKQFNGNTFKRPKPKMEKKISRKSLFGNTKRKFKQQLKRRKCALAALSNIAAAEDRNGLPVSYKLTKHFPVCEPKELTTGHPLMTTKSNDLCDSFQTQTKENSQVHLRPQETLRKKKTSVSEHLTVNLVNNFEKKTKPPGSIKSKFLQMTVRRTMHLSDISQNLDSNNQNPNRVVPRTENEKKYKNSNSLQKQRTPTKRTSLSLQPVTMERSTSSSTKTNSSLSTAQKMPKAQTNSRQIDKGEGFNVNYKHFPSAISKHTSRLASSKPPLLILAPEPPGAPLAAMAKGDQQPYCLVLKPASVAVKERYADRTLSPSSASYVAAETCTNLGIPEALLQTFRDREPRRSDPFTFRGLGTVKVEISHALAQHILYHGSGNTVVHVGETHLHKLRGFNPRIDRPQNTLLELVGHRTVLWPQSVEKYRYLPSKTEPKHQKKNINGKPLRRAADVFAGNRPTSLAGNLIRNLAKDSDGNGLGNLARKSIIKSDAMSASHVGNEKANVKKEQEKQRASIQGESKVVKIWDESTGTSTGMVMGAVIKRSSRSGSRAHTFTKRKSIMRRVRNKIQIIRAAAVKKPRFMEAPAAEETFIVFAPQKSPSAFIHGKSYKLWHLPRTILSHKDPHNVVQCHYCGKLIELWVGLQILDYKEPHNVVQCHYCGKRKAQFLLDIYSILTYSTKNVCPSCCFRFHTDRVSSLLMSLKYLAHVGLKGVCLAVHDMGEVYDFKLPQTQQLSYIVDVFRWHFTISPFTTRGPWVYTQIRPLEQKQVPLAKGKNYQPKVVVGSWGVNRPLGVALFAKSWDDRGPAV